MGNDVMIKNLPPEERPRERLLKYGAKALSNAELLAVLIRTGTRCESAIDVAHNILQGDMGKSGLDYVVDASVEELSKIRGIGKAKAIQIKAAVELGRRISSHKRREQFTIMTALDVKYLLMEEMRFLEKEHFRAILLDVKNHVISVEEISVGTLNSSIVHPREVFKPAIRRSSASILLVHNHPSGDPTPSKEDIEITKRLVDAGMILGINVLDHIIIGNDSILSLRERNLM